MLDFYFKQKISKSYLNIGTSFSHNELAKIPKYIFWITPLCTTIQKYKVSFFKESNANIQLGYSKMIQSNTIQKTFTMLQKFSTSNNSFFFKNPEKKKKKKNHKNMK